MAFFHFFKRRATFARHLAASNSGLTPSRYFRLMSMSLALMIWNLLIFALTLSFNYRNGLRPWTNWADVRSNWLAVGRFPIALIPAPVLQWTYFLWWTIPATAYMFFAFFAFGRDAVSEYGACVTWVKRNIFRHRPSTKGTKLSAAGIPSFAPIGYVQPFTCSNATSHDSRFRSYPSPRTPSSACDAFSKARQPLSPTTSNESSRLSFPVSPTTAHSATSLYSYVGDGEYKEKAFDVASVPTPEDDPTPPYSSATPLSPDAFAILTVSIPPAALVVDGGHTSIVSSHAHTDQIV